MSGTVPRPIMIKVCLDLLKNTNLVRHILTEYPDGNFMQKLEKAKLKSKIFVCLFSHTVQCLEYTILWEYKTKQRLNI